MQNNSRGGYLLTFENQGEFMRQTLVRGWGNDIQLEATGGSIAQSHQGHGMQKITLDLGFRFVLAVSARQGIYAWPMRLSVAPL